MDNCPSMKRIATDLAKFIFAFAFFIGTIQAQNPTSAVDILNERGSRFSQNGVNLVRDDLRIIANSNPASKEIFEQATINHIWASVLTGVGGFAIGFTVGRWMLAPNDQFNLPLLMSGVAVMTFTIPLWMGYGRHARRAMKAHNAHLLDDANTRNLPPSLELGWTPQGPGLWFRF